MPSSPRTQMTESFSFSKLEDMMSMPYLLQTQLDSFDNLIKKGVKEVFKEVFPIKSFDEKTLLQFVHHRFDSPKYAIEECRRRGITYSSALKVTLRLKREGDVREQEIYMGDIPLMTDTGSFIINGAERVIVSQLQRSPGVCYEKKIQPNEKRVFSARVIPYRGAWLEFEFDESDLLYVYIDRRRKMLATTLFRALGYSTDEDICRLFYNIETVKIKGKEILESLIDRRPMTPIVDESTGEVLVDVLQPITEAIAQEIVKRKIKTVELVQTEGDTAIITTLAKDTRKTEEDALIDIYRRMRPGDPPTVVNSRALLNRLFFDPKRYDLAKVGRYKINKKLKFTDVPESHSVLRKEDLIEVVKYLIEVKKGTGRVDDIDHLGNRRVMTVGELVQNQLRIGLVRMERAVRERMSIQDVERMVPHNLVNSKLVSSAIKDFFQRSQLSQFMDQVNPLAELTHKRRLSALGPGGLSRERAGFEVRDVHYSHYGRICPIETPEGPNIGLISSLATYAKINKYGFVETPYRKVEKGRVLDQIDYMTADEEDNYHIAQAHAVLDKHGAFVEKELPCRYRDDYPIMAVKDIDYMDVSPKQLFSVAASLIPFLEHDDANRALMGSNMQRQAVPLLHTDAPCVGTGLEGKAAIDSGAVITAKYAGVVKSSQSTEITIETKVGEQVYPLRKFQRSNAGTSINQRPLVVKGDKVKKNEVIADGTATQNGRLALGRNMLVAFMSWGGYNFEDAILISEKVVKEDCYTSLHIEEFSIEARDSKLGEEEITRDIPNVGEEALHDLDKDGIIRIGAEVGPGKILVGKVVPKSETELSPEEKLLRAIFGEKAGDVRDASLRVPSGVEGIVVDTKIFSRKEKDLSDEQRLEEKDMAERINGEFEKTIQEVEKSILEHCREMVLGKKFTEDILDARSDVVLIKAKKALVEKDLKELFHADLSDAEIVGEEDLSNDFRVLMAIQRQRLEELHDTRERELNRIFRGDELPPGVIKMVKVYVASKRRLSVGDKMAGRHGNKGVVAKILPEEDMPFLEDGTPVDIVLNPLGVPSRMNVGQILETHLGLAAKALGLYTENPVFDGATEKEIRDLLNRARDEHPEKSYINETGITYLRDGRTGKRFSQKVTVGYIYMLKLAHLVDDKIHARAIGPYSLVTQQPLGGKAQFGGQRFGEMEVWALEAYGAAYVLQEMLTVKSDDVFGRTKMYEAIVKGKNVLQCGTPESFNVLIKELQSLAIDAHAAHLADIEPTNEG